MKKHLVICYKCGSDKVSGFSSFPAILKEKFSYKCLKCKHEGHMLATPWKVEEWT